MGSAIYKLSDRTYSENFMLLELGQLRIQPGRQILIDRVSWQQFESILTELGARRAARVSYSNGILEIMVPLPEHEKAKETIGDIVKMLLTEGGLIMMR